MGKIGSMEPKNVVVTTIGGKPMSMYVLLRANTKAARTYVHENKDGLIVGIDYDEQGGVIGVEVVYFDGQFEQAVVNPHYGQDNKEDVG